MSRGVEDIMIRIPVIRQIILLCKKVKLPGFEGLSLFDLFKTYLYGIIEGTFTTRAGSIAFSCSTLHRRRIVRHDHDCRDSQQPTHQCYCLGVVAGGVCNDAARSLFVCKLRNSVECAAKLEGTDPLKVLTF